MRTKETGIDAQLSGADPMTARTAQRERAIQAVIRTGRAPGRNVKWSAFCDLVRAARGR